MLNKPDDTQPSLRFSVATFAPRAVGLLAFTALSVGALKSGLLNIYALGAEDYLAYDGLLLLICGIASIGLIGRKLGLNGLWLICYTSVPLGLVWSAHEYVLALASIDPTADEELALTIIGLLTPLVAAALVCTFAFFNIPDVPPEAMIKLSPARLVAFSMLPVFILIVGYISIWGVWLPLLIFSGDTILVLLGSIGLALCRRHSYSRPFTQFLVEDYANVLMDGGKITAFFGAATCALFYIPMSRLGDPSLLGATMSLSVLCVLFGCLVYSIAVILSSQSTAGKNQDRLRLDLWHLGESYAFVLLATLAPTSLFDYIGLA
jgi:hypothetical protein